MEYADQLPIAEKHFDVSDLKEFFFKIEEIHSRINAINHKTSYLFNVFDLFCVDENKMSEILIFLLDPKANHGQGDIYLKKFFELFKINIKGSDDISVLREHKKIDILIRVGNAFVIIESKYRGAKDQDQQLERYYNEIIQNKGASEDSVYVLYLKDGTFPSEHSLNLHLRQKLLINNKLRYISFPKLADQTNVSIVDFLFEAKKISSSFKMQLYIEDIICNIQGDRCRRL